MEHLRRWIGLLIVRRGQRNGSFRAKWPRRVRTVWKYFQTLTRRLCAKLAYLLRATGLKSLDYLIHDHHRPEKPKPVLQISFWIALSRCAVHLVPMAVFAWLLFMNWRMVYIGPGFSVNDKYDDVYLALFQVAAKIQEILCFASLATLLLEILRDGLLYGNGIPLGLLTSHLWFSQPNSMFSPEFLTAAEQSIRACSGVFVCNGKKWRFNPTGFMKLWRGLRLVLLLFILALLAAFIGPFSAVLLIPRYQSYPSGGTDYFLNATADELWPNVVTADAEAEACSWGNATQYPICPCGGFTSLLERATLRSIYDSENFRQSAQVDTSTDTNFLTLDSMGVMPAMITSGADRNGFWGWESTWQCQPNAYSVVFLQTLVRDWVSAAASPEIRPAPFSALSNLIHVSEPSAQAESTFPLTYVRCSQPQNLSRSAETADFQFVRSTQSTRLRYEGWSADNDTKAVNITSLIRTSSSHLRTQWISLPTEDFGPVSAGLLFELPWSQPSDTRLAITCTIAASWAQGSMYRSGSDYGAWYIGNTGIQFGPTLRNISTTLSPSDPKARHFNRRIALHENWLAMLTPSAPVQPGVDSTWQHSTLEHIFFVAGFGTMMQDLRQFPFYVGTDTGCAVEVLNATWTDIELWNARICSQADKLGFIERTIARLVTDGLSRRLSSRAYVMLPSLRAWIVAAPPRNDDYNLKLLVGKENAVNMSSDPSLVTQRVYFSVSGYVYRASTTTDYAATAVAAVYLLLSFSHVVWTLIQCKTSSSWDTAIELLMLAWNSPPTAIMKGTSANIRRWDTYKRLVKVHVRKEASRTALGAGREEQFLELSIIQQPGAAAHQALGSTTNLQSSAEVPVVDPGGSNSDQHSGVPSSTPSTITISKSLTYCSVEVDKKYY